MVSVHVLNLKVHFFTSERIHLCLTYKKAPSHLANKKVQAQKTKVLRRFKHDIRKTMVRLRLNLRKNGKKIRWFKAQNQEILRRK